MKSVLILCPYPKGISPSQRFRFELFMAEGAEYGIWFEQKAFWSLSAYNRLFKNGNALFKIMALLAGFFRRFAHVFSAIPYDYVLIHRECSPIGPPIFEFLLAHVLRKKIIFDYDDAIWLPNTSEENKIAAGLKFHSKFKLIAKWAYSISAGNDYLVEEGRRYNAKVYYLPTVVDTKNEHVPQEKNESKKVTIGWTGSHSTMRFLDPVIPLLQQLKKDYDFTFLVISNKNPKIEMEDFQFLPWNKDTEISDLAKIDIGIMPLENDQWSRGKCAFKLIQYSSLQIPSIADNIPPNDLVLGENEGGILVNNEKEWEAAVKNLLLSQELRKKLGSNARERIEAKYSKSANISKFMSLFA